MIPIPLGYFGNQTLPVRNTFIGGVSGVITSAADLAGYLSVTETNISNFTITGDDISCYINTNYSINNHAFNNDGSAFDWGNGNIVTYYWDDDGSCTGWGIALFDEQTILKNVYFPGLTTDDGQEVFKNNNTTNETVYILPNLTAITANDEMWLNGDSCIIIMPEITNLGGTSGNNNLFNVSDRMTVYVDASLATNNGGSPDGDLQYLAGRTDCTINYSDNNTAPSDISDLALNGSVGGSYIPIDWTAPSSSNSIDYYLIFVNHKYIVKTTSLSYTITGLQANTSYEIFVITLDIEGNFSFSNTLTQSTASTYTIPTGNIVSYWDFDGDSLDQVGSNDGTDTSVSYVSSGGIGNVASFTAGTSSKIQVADAANLSFGDGLSDSAFSISFRVKWNATPASTVFFNKKNTSTGQDAEYQVSTNGSNVEFLCFDNLSGNQITVTSSYTFSVSTWYHIIATYDGSGSQNGMETYVDGVLTTPTRSTLGSYTAMENETSPLTIGKNAQNTSRSLNGYMDETAIFDKELTALEVLEIYAKNQDGLYLTE